MQCLDAPGFLTGLVKDAFNLKDKTRRENV
jgi:hypothetical protein